MAASELSPKDLREMSDVSNLAVSGERDMVNLIEAVDDMGSFRLFWDSKIPNNEKGFFNFISFKVSDPEVMKTEIQKYKDFYSNMKDAVRKVRNGEEDAEDSIQELYDTLSTMAEEAELEKDGTDSKTLCRLHEEFVARHEKLENKIKRVEIVAVRQQLKNARDDWRNAVKEIRKVKENMQQARDENKDLTDRFEKLMSLNEQLVVQQQELRKENILIRTLLEDLIRRQQ